MRHLNYGHLLYFWTVAREGSIARAAELLHITPQTISGQLRLLEDSIDAKLFARSGRSLVLTEMGQLVFRYADELFGIGAELAEVVRGRRPTTNMSFTVGITDAVPKLLAQRVLSQVLQLEPAPKIVCDEGNIEHLIGELAIHNLDLVLADAPVPPGLHVRAYSHLLGESGIAFLAREDVARSCVGEFPRSLTDAPLLMPRLSSVLGRSLTEWFGQVGVFPRIVGEFADSALMKAFAQSGAGIIAQAAAIRQDIESSYGLRCLGMTDEVSERFYAISVERRLKHPAVVSITEGARQSVFQRNGHQ